MCKFDKLLQLNHISSQFIGSDCLHMLRPFQFFIQAYRQRDLLAVCIVAWIIVVIGWSVSMVFSTVMRDMALKRFHLESESFLCWAVNQSVPSMYNFENRVQFTNQLIGDGPFDATDETYDKATLNHFPARYITFGDMVPRCFSKTRQGTFEMESRFADTTLTTRWEISDREGTLEVNPLGRKFSRGNQVKNQLETHGLGSNSVREANDD